MQRIQLDFDPKVPEFSIIEADSPPEFYSSLFQSSADVDGRALARVRQELDEGKFHPLGGDDTSGLLRSFVAQLSSRGEFLPNAVPEHASEDPKIGRCPVIFLRHRDLGFAVAIESILESLGSDASLPSSLLRIVGIADESPTVSEPMRPSHWVDEAQPADVLLSKPANPEQVRIAQRLRQHGSVLVQGPPGTGKTHTIANLIGDLLAEGKSVLVTSHTSKALRVLRDQVVPQLRPLCVSLLDSDTDSRKQLESSVEAMVTRLSLGDAQQLERQAQEIETHRHQLIAKFQTLSDAILNARADEYRDIVIAGASFTPSDAARRVTAGKGTHDYIPGPVELGAALPLTASQIASLYETNLNVSAEHEVELGGVLPRAEELFSASEFDELVAERAQLAAQNFTYGSNFWSRQVQDDDRSRLEQLSTRLRDSGEQIRSATPWQLTAMEAGYDGGSRRKPWEGLLRLIEDTWTRASAAEDILLQHQPKLPTTMPLDQARALCEEICKHLGRGGELSFLTLLARPSWKTFITGSSVGLRQPRDIEHFYALRALADVASFREQLIARWNVQLGALGVPAGESLGPEPERVCRQYIHSIQECLNWCSTTSEPLATAVAESGLTFERVVLHEPPDSQGGELGRLANVMCDSAQRIIAARTNLLRWEVTEDKILSLKATLRGSRGDVQATKVIERLSEAVASLSGSCYRNALTGLLDLDERRKFLESRRQLLAVLRPVAPGWAVAIAERSGLHGRSIQPDNLEAAWVWRQLNDELDRRAQVSIALLQAEQAQTVKSIREVTTELIESKAWAAQLRRTEGNLPQKQALIGWLNTIRKIGKGTGIRVPKLKAEANKLMSQCRAAVPVWVMPLSRVADNFDPRTTRFDVVIVDEASQSDAMGLLALYLGEKAIVVGDHEQVSPSAVGQDLGVIQHLIDEHLNDVPNSHLYDGQLSIYDLARESFGGTIRLVEHFRSVPEIIEFSNNLCYEGAIRPLRDCSSVKLKPHIIAHRVPDGASHNKSNAREAQEVAALVLAACEQPEYNDKTLGVISLVGEVQAVNIEILLRSHMPEEAFKTRHNILCGNPAQFQGDERDVIFLSTVDTSDGSVLRLRDEPKFKQRFNVAASRARDQMWVVHSLDARSHLKPDDLRRRLIEYAEDPTRIVNTISALERVTESPFEQAVAAHLTRAGYSVTPQWRVGYYRIDIVVQGNGKRLAIECDGDRFHPIEKLQDDMARQAVLERLGWKFIRIRGSQFFRDPERCMDSVVEDLSAYGIGPNSSAPRPTQQPSAGDEMIQRVIRRAQQIRREWANSGKSVSVSREDDAKNPENASLTSPVTPTPAALTRDQARQKLISLRDNRIARELPNVDPKRRLLRDQMIAVLLQEQPTTEKEWIDRLPLWMRKETDQQQVGKYLPAVLKVISEMYGH